MDLNLSAFDNPKITMVFEKRMNIFLISRGLEVVSLETA
jgi:hypothetical protein